MSTHEIALFGIISIVGLGLGGATSGVILDRTQAYKKLILIVGILLSGLLGGFIAVLQSGCSEGVIFTFGFFMGWTMG